jgi:glucose dehydrogenase
MGGINATSFGGNHACSRTKLLSQLAVSAATARSEDLVEMQSNAANVVMPTITYDNQRYSTLNHITARNVGKLQVAWTFSTGVLRGHEGAPLVIGDVMYVHPPFPNTVFALDLSQDGRILWKYEPKQDPNVIPVMCCDTVDRGLAYADGKLFLHQVDTREHAKSWGVLMSLG